MTERRLNHASSRTAAWTCISRAVSYAEKDPIYHSEDYIAPHLLPRLATFLLSVPLLGRYIEKHLPPPGIYEYVIVRTKFMDATLQQALEEGFQQVLIFGAGFDSRANRFDLVAHNCTLYELDNPYTQSAKLGQFNKRGIPLPDNTIYLSIDFETESLPEKLAAAGFQLGQKTLFMMEGLLMYLTREAIEETFALIRQYSGPGSQLIFDIVHASVMRQEYSYFGEAEIFKNVKNAGEGWQTGMEMEEVSGFLLGFGYTLVEMLDVEALQARYFTRQDGSLAGRINGTHFLVSAVFEG